MIPVPQRIVASAKDSPPGDCFKCCVASVLELPYEEVPHFVAHEWLVEIDGKKEKANWFTSFFDWMKITGWPIRPEGQDYIRSVEEVNRLYGHIKDPAERWGGLNQFVLEPRPRNFRPGFWIANVTSQLFPGKLHCVVMEGGKVVFDPSPHERTVPYQFTGEIFFVALNPALCKPRP